MHSLLIFTKLQPLVTHSPDGKEMLTRLSLLAALFYTKSIVPYWEGEVNDSRPFHEKSPDLSKIPSKDPGLADSLVVFFIFFFELFNFFIHRA